MVNLIIILILPAILFWIFYRGYVKPTASFLKDIIRHPDLAYNFFMLSDIHHVFKGQLPNNYREIVPKPDWGKPYTLFIPKFRNEKIWIFGKIDKFVESENEFLSVIKIIDSKNRNKEYEKTIKINVAKAENIYKYFKSTEYWKELSDDTLKYLAEIFDMDFLSFSSFVDMSELLNLHKDNFLKLEKAFPEPKERIPYFAVTMERSGARSMKFFEEKGDEIFKADAIKCYESSIKLNPFLYPSFGALALIAGHCDHDKDMAIEYCNRGFEAFDRLKNTPNEKLSYYDRALLSQNLACDFLSGIKTQFLGE